VAAGDGIEWWEYEISAPGRGPILLRFGKGGASMRKLFGSVLILFVAFAFVAAEEFTASVTKMEGNKITVKKFGGKKGAGGGEPITLTLADNCKFTKGKFDLESKKSVADGDLEGGKEGFAKRVKEAAEKKPDPDKAKGKGKGFGFGGGVFATIITDGEGESAKVTEIRVTNFGGFKKKQDK
jgi:hypothetical protein